MKIQWSLGVEGREKGRSFEDGLISVGAEKPTLRAIKLVSGLGGVGEQAGPDHIDSCGCC